MEIYKNKGGVNPATETEVRRAVTDGANAVENKAVTPRGLFWFWDELTKYAGTFLGLFLGRSDAPGNTRTIAAQGGEANIDLVLQPKGTGKVKAGLLPSRVVTTDPASGLEAVHVLADEFIAVPPLFTSPGIPGQKAWDGTNLWYCIATNTWVRFPSESAAVLYAALFTAVPATLTSTGIQGQMAHDTAAQLFYICTAANTWIRFSAVPETYAGMYVAVPPTPTSAGLQGQRAYDSTNNLMYECVANNTWIRHTIVSTW